MPATPIEPISGIFILPSGATVLSQESSGSPLTVTVKTSPGLSRAGDAEKTTPAAQK